MNYRKFPFAREWCRWSDSNRHDFLGSQDFKSCASAISPHRQPFSRDTLQNLQQLMFALVLAFERH
jgi:hypothetical protein